MEDEELEKLIALARTPPTKLEEKIAQLAQKQLPEAHRFALAKNIQEGNKKITYKQIYYLYQLWAGPQAIPINAFGRQFAKLFRRRRDKDGSFYKLDPTPFKEILSVNKEDKKEDPKTEST